MSGGNEVLKKLIVDEKDTIKEMEKLVGQASKYFRIEKPSGRIIFQNFGALTDQQRICIILVGKYFANNLGFIKDCTLSISDIAKELGRPMTTLSKYMRSLASRGFIERLPGRKYRIAYHRISEIFENILFAKRKG